MSDPGDPNEPNDEARAPASNRRVIKRYSNRKLYDTRESRYVTLLEIAELVRAGEDVQVIDNATKEDKTDVTLALIISEELKNRPKGIPLNTLRALILEHGERLLNQLRDVPIKRLVPWDIDDAEPGGTDTQPAASAAGESHRKSNPLDSIPSAALTGQRIRATLEQWQQAIDERIRTVVPNFSAVSDLERELRQLGARIATLEAHVGLSAQKPNSGSPQGSAETEE